LARVRLDAATTADEAAGRALRQLDQERVAHQAHLTAEEQRLYGGAVTVPKELQGLQREVDALRRRQAVLDEHVLEAMLAADAARSERDGAQAALDAALDAASSGQQALGAEREKLQQALAHLARARERHAPQVPADELGLYEQLRSKLGVRVVASLKDEHCGGCGMALPLHQIAAVRSGQRLLTCHHCGRILVA
jgi:predicted  nucleic acid-binding Zn-ribbon protein